MSAASRRARSSGSDRRALALLLSLCLLLASAAAAAAELAEMRAARRAAMRAAIPAEGGAAASFGLLVIPVDFHDARFSPDFSPARDLLPRLTGDQPGSLSHYFRIASRGRTALVVQLAPPVSLPGARLDYSDRYWQGNERSRLLAGLALARAADFGTDFAAVDRDRDGEVDGVLLLHAAAGAENDPDGLILPLQFFLATPVDQRGTRARSYAIASARSSLGVWAHETGHLLGLEDRYDFGFGGGDVAPRGGLGRYSLMAAGWLGSGQGEDPALPDAYSCLQLGWVDVGPRLGPATVVRLDYHDGPGPEFFLVEQRYPELTAPYDAALTAQRLLLLHIDETLAEGQASGVDWPARHLRVNLVQADGSDTVARGTSQGQAADLFPADGAWQAFDDGTFPAARAFDGRPTGVAFTAAVDGGQLEFTAAGTAATVDLRLVFVAGGDVVTPRVLARVLTAGDLPDDLAVTLVCEDTAWGRFASGSTLATTLTRSAAAVCGWAHYGDTGLEPWLPAADVPATAVTVFTYSVDSAPGGAGEVAWPWRTDAAPLALDGAWPGGWLLPAGQGADNTRWHRWLDGPGGAGAMLACTGANFASGAAWPGVAYGGRAHAVLQSPLLGADVRWLELTFAVDLELLYPGMAMDAVGLTWRHANGRAVVAAEPADGWLGTTYSKARHPLSGRPTFAVADPLHGPDAQPLWRREVLPLPARERHGPGPWRLQLELASDAVQHGRGWLVRDLAGHLGEPPSSAFAVQVAGDRLQWTWSGGDPVASYTVQISEDGGATWAARAADLAGGAAGELPVLALGLREGRRTLARVLAHTATGTLVSRGVALVAARLPELGAPRPNPAGEVVQIAVDAAGDARAVLSLHDLRGRELRAWRPGGEVGVVAWDGTDAAGRPAAAGVYLFRLQALDRIQTRKVTWLP